MDTCVQAFLVVLLCAFASSVSAIKCYQCNLECRNGTAEGCDLKNGPDVTIVKDNDTLSQRVSCETPTEMTNCKACMTIKTTNRRYTGRGEFSTVDEFTRVCQVDESPYSEDVCNEDGPSWAPSIKCYCYSDLCNSAERNLPLIIPLFTYILYIMF